MVTTRRVGIQRKRIFQKQEKTVLITYKRIPTRSTTDFSPEAIEARKQSYDIKY